ncbi:MFS transporter [Xylogone sp. PMI_703]|nr:MFS transporter [Xylogone sp. PMI_703]
MDMNIDEQTIHRLEEELHVKIYPGTEIMADVGEARFVHSGNSSESVLVPQPSNDPHDPLNWNRKWKFTAMFLATLATFTQAMGPLAIAPQFPALMESFDRSLADVVDFSGICILVLGFSNFFWVPMQTAFGRRPVLIFSTLGCVAASIWKAKAKSYASFMGASVLHGFAAGPGESIQPTIVTDIMFLHERGIYNTLYFFSYFGGVTIGPVLAGPMTEHVDWQSFWWLNVALYAAICVAALVFFPETLWHRQNTKSMGSGLGLEAKGSSENGLTDSVKETPADVREPTTAHEENSVLDPYLGRGNPSKQQFKFLQANSHPFKSMLREFWVPWKLFAFPIVEFAAFAVSWSASVFLTLNLTQSQIFSDAPYNLSPQTVGLFNLATLVGAAIGLATCGPLSDWVSMRSTRRSNGIREPEMRLPTLIPYMVLMVIGNFIVAFGYQYKWAWEIIVLIGYTLGGLQVAAIPSIIATYAVDSYKPVTGSIFIAITVNKNVWGYGFSKFISTWIASDGAVKPIMLNMCLTFLFCSIGIVFYIWGKTFRKWTRNSKVHSM